MVRAPNGEEYIIRGYMDDMAGLVIPDNWVVKADNGHYWQFERSDLAAKSTNHCPTYGNCLTALVVVPLVFIARIAKLLIATIR